MALTTQTLNIKFEAIMVKSGLNFDNAEYFIILKGLYEAMNLSGQFSVIGSITHHFRNSNTKFESNLVKSVSVSGSLKELPLG